MVLEITMGRKLLSQFWSEIDAKDKEKELKMWKCLGRLLVVEGNGGIFIQTPHVASQFTKYRFSLELDWMQ